MFMGLFALALIVLQCACSGQIFKAMCEHGGGAQVLFNFKNLRAVCRILAIHIHDLDILFPNVALEIVVYGIAGFIGGLCTCRGMGLGKCM